MTARRRTWGKVAAGLALSAAFLWLALRNADPELVLGHLRGVEMKGLVFAILAILTAHGLRILRWGVLVRPFAELGIAALSRVANLGMFLGFVLPLRLGELARPYLVKRECGAPLSAGLGAAAVERTLDGMLVTLGYFLAVTALPESTVIPPVLRAAAWGALALFGAALSVIVLALLARPVLLRLVRILGRPFPRQLVDGALGLVDGFVSGLKALPDLKVLTLLVLTTAVIWCANALGFYAIMLGFGWDLPPLAGFVVMSIVVFGIMIPAGPGFLGTYQAGIALGLAVFGRDATEAAAFGVVSYFLSLGVLASLGLPYLFTTGWRSGGRAPLRQLVDEPLADRGDGEDGAPPGVAR